MRQKHAGSSACGRGGGSVGKEVSASIGACKLLYIVLLDVTVSHWNKQDPAEAELCQRMLCKGALHKKHSRTIMYHVNECKQPCVLRMIECMPKSWDGVSANVTLIAR